VSACSFSVLSQARRQRQCSLPLGGCQEGRGGGSRGRELGAQRGVRRLRGALCSRRDGHMSRWCAAGETIGLRRRGAPGWEILDCGRGAHCDNMPSHSHPAGEKARQTVSPGSPVGEYPPRKDAPRSTHARRRQGEDTPREKHEVGDRKFTCPRQSPRGNIHASPSYPLHTPVVPLQPSRKHPSDTLR